MNPIKVAIQRKKWSQLYGTVNFDEDTVEESADEGVGKNIKGSAGNNVGGSAKGVDDMGARTATWPVKSAIDNIVRGAVDGAPSPVERVADLDNLLHYTRIATFASLAAREANQKDTSNSMFQAFDDLRISK